MGALLSSMFLAASKSKGTGGGRVRGGIDCEGLSTLELNFLIKTGTNNDAGKDKCFRTVRESVMSSNGRRIGEGGKRCKTHSDQRNTKAE